MLLWQRFTLPKKEIYIDGRGKANSTQRAKRSLPFTIALFDYKSMKTSQKESTYTTKLLSSDHITVLRA